MLPHPCRPSELRTGKCCRLETVHKSNRQKVCLNTILMLDLNTATSGSIIKSSRGLESKTYITSIHCAISN